MRREIKSKDKLQPILPTTAVICLQSNCWAAPKTTWRCNDGKDPPSCRGNVGAVITIFSTCCQYSYVEWAATFEHLKITMCSLVPVAAFRGAEAVWDNNSTLDFFCPFSPWGD